jgi:hypothetical protein
MACFPWRRWWALNPPNRRGTDPYARWCGRGGIARCPPIPIDPACAPGALPRRSTPRNGPSVSPRKDPMDPPRYARDTNRRPLKFRDQKTPITHPCPCAGSGPFGGLETGMECRIVVLSSSIRISLMVRRAIRPLRLRGGVGSRDSAHHERPRADWIETAVPTVVAYDIFVQAQELLGQTRSLRRVGRSNPALCRVSRRVVNAAMRYRGHRPDRAHATSTTTDAWVRTLGAILAARCVIIGRFGSSGSSRPGGMG